MGTKGLATSCSLLVMKIITPTGPLMTIHYKIFPTTDSGSLVLLLPMLLLLSDVDTITFISFSLPLYLIPTTLSSHTLESDIAYSNKRRTETREEHTMEISASAEQKPCCGVINQRKAGNGDASASESCTLIIPTGPHT